MRGLCFGIVDEADSVLIDEARTPLILSRESKKPFDEDIYHLALDLAGRLKADQGDFRVDNRHRNIILRQPGKKRLAQLVTERSDFWHSARRREEIVTKALLAKHLHKRDLHYLVRDNKVEIIDENTGRTMPDRSWEAGLHQMVEAKEGCSITGIRETMGRITYQRFFRRYLRLGAMTGTATEVASELWSVYKLRVVRVASHKPSRRVRWRGCVHNTAAEKWATVVARIRMLQQQRRPVLIGTRTVGASEHLSELLDQAGLVHQVLNARQDRQEAEIIAKAGEPGRITVATNMAGRGTDIQIGTEVAASGGLHVIATERNEARRIDRQLFGRCGRQGDSGSFEEIVSLEDEIIAFCAPRPIIKILQALDSGKFPLARWAAVILMRGAQRSVERRHAEMRRELLKQDLRLSDALAFTGPTE
jgi:preprotein translocase subunit SecA